MATVTKVALLGGEPKLAERLKQFIGDGPNQVDFNYVPQGVKEISRIQPDIVILVQQEQEQGVEIVQWILATLPATVIFYVSDRNDFYVMRDIIRAGASDYFVLPDELPLIETQLEKNLTLINQREKQSTMPSFKKGRGRILSFYSGKGGSGTTLMATSFAQTLRLDSTARVLFIDLNIQFGGAESYLGIESDRSLADLQPVIEEVNEGHIRNVVQKEKHSGLEVLLSPRDAEAEERLGEDFIAKLLRACRRSYDYVILDLPSYMNAINLVALEESDRIYYVMVPDTPSLRIFKAVERLFARLHVNLESRMEILLNQKSRENEINVQDIRNILGKPITVEITKDDRNVQKAMNMSQPLRKEPNEKKIPPVAKDIRKWVTAVVE